MCEIVYMKPLKQLTKTRNSLSKNPKIMIQILLRTLVLVTIFYKMHILYRNDIELSLPWLFWIPSIFISDSLFLGFLWWVYRLSTSTSIILFIRCLLLVFIVNISFVYLLVIVMANTFLSVTGSVINFALIGSVSEDISGFGPMLASQGSYIMQSIGIIFLSFCVVYIYSRKRVQREYTKIGRKSKCKALLWIFPVITYGSIIFLYRPMDPWNLLAKNVLFEIIEAPNREQLPDEMCFTKSPFNMAPKNLLDLTQYTNSTSNPLFIQPKRVENVDNFDFIKRKNDSTIKNIVWVFIESGRSDVWPMDYNANFAQQKLTAEARKLKNITPFYDSFAKKGVIVDGATTAAAYTIKALLSSFCSMSPMPIDFSKEADYQYYKTCLPQLLNDHGFKSKYFQAADAKFDSQDLILTKTGVEWFSKKNIDQGELNKFDVIPETVNYFGYQDEVLIPKMMEFIDENQASNTPYFLSLLTNVNHHPFGTPSSWKMQPFSTDQEFQKIFNSIAYVDHVLENLMEELRKKDPKNETLYILTGDHGHSYVAHGLFGTANVGYEQNYKISMMLYTENEKWKSRFAGKILKGNYQNKDIVPTILDVLNDEKFNNDVRIEYGYEGDSLLHAYRSRPSVSFANPGFSSMSYREHGFKLLFHPNSCKFVVYDLISDPEELYPIHIKNGTVEQWERYAKNQIQIEIERVRLAYNFEMPKSTSSVYLVSFLGAMMIAILYFINIIFKEDEEAVDPYSKGDDFYYE
ncbi:alkaline-phosphatase-like protein [Globomyces pollinis-pini]|nr:alkaline-phosphatase-like protein [Globomyces pollinis-pini]